MRATLFVAIMAISMPPAFAGSRCGLTSCQAIYQACLVDSKSMGGTDANCNYQLEKSKTTHSWHVKTKNFDCPCQ
jgi:hypothetical protein